MQKTKSLSVIDGKGFLVYNYSKVPIIFLTASDEETSVIPVPLPLAF